LAVQKCAGEVIRRLARDRTKMLEAHACGFGAGSSEPGACFAPNRFPYVNNRSVQIILFRSGLNSAVYS
jgi:hypothetical protein